MRSHAARFALAARPRGNDEIEISGAERRDQRSDGGGIVGAVAVHEDDDIGVVGRLRAGEAGSAVAAADLDDFGAGGARARSRVPSPLPPSATIIRPTISRGNSATTAAMDSASLKVGMTTATRAAGGGIATGSSAIRSWRKPPAACSI